MVVGILVAIVVGITLLMVLARYATEPAVLRAALGARGRTTPVAPEIAPERLRSIVTELFEAMGLRIIQAESLGHGATRLVAVGRGVLRDARHIIYLEASPAGYVVGAPALLALAEDVMHDEAALGVLVTPYEIDRSGVGGISADLELIDGRALVALIDEHLPEHGPEMRRHRIANAVGPDQVAEVG